MESWTKEHFNTSMDRHDSGQWQTLQAIFKVRREIKVGLRPHILNTWTTQVLGWMQGVRFIGFWGQRIPIKEGTVEYCNMNLLPFRKAEQFPKSSGDMQCMEALAGARKSRPLRPDKCIADTSRWG